MAGGFLGSGFLASGFMAGAGDVQNCYTICQFNGFIGNRIIGGPRRFCVEVIQYVTGIKGWKILFFDRTDKTQKIGELSSDIGEGALSSLTFNLVPTGCGSFEIALAIDLTTLAFELELNQGIEIYLYHDESPWYAGYILDVTATGSTKRPWIIKGAGYFNQLETCIVDEDYVTTEVSDIVREVMTDFIDPKTDIIYADYKIITTDYEVTDIRFDHDTGRTAIQQLAGLAQEFVYGVDEKKELFFHGTNPTVNPLAIFAIGKHLDGIDITEDVDNIMNRVYVKAGNLAGAPKTNIRATVEDHDSQVRYGLREKVMSAPALRDDTDAERWGQAQVWNNKYPKKKASIGWVDCSRGPIKADGKARILCGRQEISRGPSGVRVDASNRDGHERDDTTVCAFNSNTLRAGDVAGVNRRSCFQFCMDIREGEEVLGVTLRINATVVGSPIIRIYGEDVGDAAVITAVNGDISGRSLTTAYVDWTPATASTTWFEIDVTDIIKEITRRWDFNPGNYLSIILIDNGSPNNERAEIDAWDPPTELIAALSVTYTGTTPTYELDIKKVVYKVDSKGIRCALTLGQEPRGMDVTLKDFFFKIANEELLMQHNMSQL